MIRRSFWLAKHLALAGFRSTGATNCCIATNISTTDTLGSQCLQQSGTLEPNNIVIVSVMVIEIGIVIIVIIVVIANIVNIIIIIIIIIVIVIIIIFGILFFFSLGQHGQLMMWLGCQCQHPSNLDCCCDVTVLVASDWALFQTDNEQNVAQVCPVAASVPAKGFAPLLDFHPA